MVVLVRIGAGVVVELQLPLHAGVGEFPSLTHDCLAGHP